MPIPRVRPVTLIGTATPEEKSYFEFYKTRTAIKLPPAFGTHFHHSVVLRASACEPAVLHALLALSACHKRKEIDGFCRDRSLMLPDKHEKFMLQQYSKAIHYLNALPEGNNSSLRTTLTTCLVFIYVEFLRADYQEGIKHLQSGLRLIREVKRERSPRAELSAKERKISARLHTALDEALIVAFDRQHIVAAYSSRYDSQHPRLPSDMPAPAPTMTFTSVDEAIYYIKESFIYAEAGMKEFEDHPGPFTYARRATLRRDKPILQGHLDFWSNMYANTVAKAVERGDTREVQAYKTLRAYHSMAVIVVATALIEHTQMVFDEHMPTFFSIVSQSIDAMEAGGSCPGVLGTLKKLGWTYSKSIGDVGRIPPAYYTALKCRNHRIRHCAIRILQLQSLQGELQPHFARVAEEVVRLEESGSFTGADIEIEMSDIFRCQKVQEHPPIPASRRMTKVEVLLPNGESDELQLICQQNTSEGYHYIRRVYNTSTTRWVDPDLTESII